MNGKERTIRALTHDGPDRVPVDIWTLPAAFLVHGDKLSDLISERDPDIMRVSHYDPLGDEHLHDKGIHTDIWGTEWHNHQQGILGEPKKCPLEGLSAAQIHEYSSPVSLLRVQKDEVIASAKQSVRELSDKFLLSGWCNLFERMQFLRGVENLYCDIAEENEEFFAVRDIAMEFAVEYFSIMSGIEGADGCIIGDDWGSQLSLLISPDTWRRLFKPCYKRLIGIIKENGKRVFVHSDGYTLAIYEDWIELGVDAINSQVWCMGLDKVAEATRGRITLWGELDRQNALPHGSPDRLLEMIGEMKSHFWNRGGLIGEFEAGGDVPFENVRAAAFGW